MVGTVCFRCDASPFIGGGHVMRCLTLADALIRRGWRCSFLAGRETADMFPVLRSGAYGLSHEPRPPHDCDWLVVDHYGLDVAYEKQARSWARHILAIDDLADRAHDADILLDQTYGRGAGDYDGLVPAGCRVLAGSAYALLRSRFAQIRPEALRRRHDLAGRAENILVFVSSADPVNLSPRIMRALAQVPEKLSVTFVLSPAAPGAGDVRALAAESRHDICLVSHAPDMASLMAAADIAIGAGGTASWERCCLGLPTLLAGIADNQKDTAAALSRAGAAVCLGWHEDVGAEGIAQSLRALIGHPGDVRTMSLKAAAICDGNGVERLIPWLWARVSAPDSIALRPFQPGDEALILAWQSVPETRRYARNPAAPTPQEHAAWFAARLSDRDSFNYIVNLDGRAAGMVRAHRRGDAPGFEVSVLTAPGYYGRGVAARGLALMRTFHPDADFYAEIAPENEASLRLFGKAGYIPLERNWHINRGLSQDTA